MLLCKIDITLASHTQKFRVSFEELILLFNLQIKYAVYSLYLKTITFCAATKFRITQGIVRDISVRGICIKEGARTVLTESKGI
jgi:hypothetical protein